MGFRATIKLRKYKVALNLMYIIFKLCRKMRRILLIKI